MSASLPSAQSNLASPIWKFGSGDFVLKRGIEGGACFLDSIQSLICLGEVGIAGYRIRVDLDRAFCVLQGIVELPELVIDTRQITEGSGIPRIGLAIEFVRR
jgi:hypothetical protein